MRRVSILSQNESRLAFQEYLEKSKLHGEIDAFRIYLPKAPMSTEMKFIGYALVRLPKDLDCKGQKITTNKLLADALCHIYGCRYSSIADLFYMNWDFKKMRQEEGDGPIFMFKQDNENILCVIEPPGSQHSVWGLYSYFFRMKHR